MKTATVRDLRNNFAKLAQQLEWGEEISITRHGQWIATLSPPKPAPGKRDLKARWAERLKRYKPVGRKLNKAETDAFWSSLRD